MKIVACISFLLLLTFQVFLKVGIIGYYGINRDYIAANLCENRAKPEARCNGKCYLKKQLKKADETNNDPRQPQQQKTEVQPFMQFLNGTLPLLNNSEFNFTEQSSVPMSRYIDSVFRPPAV